ncbi:MAG: nitrogenase component 1 [Hornefia sp.]|nr:nitrogenase component 1 [Hornefia sp.]
MSKIAVYGKGGIGKSTISANLSAAMACAGHRVLQIGCDPKHDSTKLLLSGRKLTTVLDYMRRTGPLEQKVEDILGEGYMGIGCVEAGGPKPGVGCAGRGIISTFELLQRFGLLQRYDTVVYDVLGDVVCGGFAVPIRREYADHIFVVTSGEFMSLYAANNILKGIQNYDGDEKRVAGIIYNKRNVKGEDERVKKFAEAVKLPIAVKVPRSDAFAKAEALGITVYQMGEDERLQEIFSRLASELDKGIKLYSANPITDEELEACLLDTSVSEGFSAKNAGENERENAGENRTENMQGGSYTENEAFYPTENRDLHSKDPDLGNNTSSKVPGKSCERECDNAVDAGEACGSPLEKPVYYFSKSLKNSEPLHGCAFNGALSTCAHLKGTVILAHAPKSCTYISYQTISSSGRRRLFERGTLLPVSLSPSIQCTEMGESEIVFGGMETLEEKIEEIKKSRPKAIVVVSSCPAGIIGDDINQTEMLSDNETKVIPLRTDGNMAGDYLQGMLMAYTTLAKAFIDKSVKPDMSVVNVLAEKIIDTNSESNLKTISGYIGRIGLRVNCRFLYNTDVDALVNFKKAGLNLLAFGDYTGKMLGDYFEKEYGAEIFRKPFPVGFDNTAKWLRALGQRVGKSEGVEEIIKSEQEAYNSRIAKLRPVLNGKKVLVITYNHELDWILKTAIDAGMEIVKIGILSFSQDEGFRSELDLNCPVELEYEKEKRTEDVERYKPDVLLTNYASSIADKVRISDIIPMCPEVGFESGVKTVERWAQLMKLNRKGDWTGDAEIFNKYYAR